MTRTFNVTGSCNPKRHYMVDLTGRLEQIKRMIDDGKYFTINRARQYGKTTTIKALTNFLAEDYTVISLDFQRIGNEEFQTAQTFSTAFSEYFLDIADENKTVAENLDKDVLIKLEKAAENMQVFSLRKLFVILSRLCKTAKYLWC